MRKHTYEIFSIKGDPYMNEDRYLYIDVSNNLYTMSPDDYITRAANILGSTYDSVIKTRSKDKSSFKYIQSAADKKSLTIPILDYKNKCQNGIHRAMWAKEQGIKKIPVIVLE